MWHVGGRNSQWRADAAVTGKVGFCCLSLALCAGTAMSLLQWDVCPSNSQDDMCARTSTMQLAVPVAGSQSPYLQTDGNAQTCAQAHHVPLSGCVLLVQALCDGRRAGQ